MNQRKLYLAGGLLCAALMVGFVILFFAGGKSGDPETFLVPQSSSSSQEAPSSGDGAGSGAASSSRPDSSSQEEASREESSREESSSQAEEDSQPSSSQETAPVDGEVSLNQVQDVYVIGGEDGLCYRVTDNNDKREFLQRLGQASPTQETPQREDPQPATVQIRMKDGTLSRYLVSEEQISLGGRLCRSTQEERERLMDLVYLCQEDYPPRPQWMASYYGMTLTQISFDGQSHDQLWAVQTTVTDPQDLEEIADLLEDLDVDGLVVAHLQVSSGMAGELGLAPALGGQETEGNHLPLPVVQTTAGIVVPKAVARQPAVDVAALLRAAVLEVPHPFAEDVYLSLVALLHPVGHRGVGLSLQGKLDPALL